jgi:hypothetical protein
VFIKYVGLEESEFSFSEIGGLGWAGLTFENTQDSGN